MCDPCCLPVWCPTPGDPRCMQGPESLCYPLLCEPICCPTPCDPCCPPQRCNDGQLMNSVFITPCECIKRNGLQDECPRKECRGRPMCMTTPNAACCPSKYSYCYANMTMGKASNPVQRKSCLKSKSSSCNPCVIGCSKTICFQCC